MLFYFLLFTGKKGEGLTWMIRASCQMEEVESAPLIAPCSCGMSQDRNKTLSTWLATVDVRHDQPWRAPWPWCRASAAVSLSIVPPHLLQAARRFLVCCIAFYFGEHERSCLGSSANSISLTRSFFQLYRMFPRRRTSSSSWQRTPTSTSNVF